MLFEHALYYPTIDIKDEAWLKSAVLLWDTISTIVPDCEYKPYQYDWSRVMNEVGILLPHRVSPYSVDFPMLERSVRAYLATAEGKRCFKCRTIPDNDYDSRYSIIHEVGYGKIRQVYGEFSISAAKFGRGLSEVIRSYVDDDGYVVTSLNFMNFYMTALANNICQRNGMALLTDMVYTSDLTSTMLKDNKNRRVGAVLLKQGLMYKLILQGIKIDPNTPIDKILKFRDKYHYEMADFRKQVSDLVNSQNTEGLSEEEVVAQMARLYRMGVLPALNNIQKALGGHTIKWVADGSSTITVTGLTTMFTQPAISPLATLAQIGLKVGCWSFNYVTGREKKIMEKPFSMLYRINKKFSLARR